MATHLAPLVKELTDVQEKLKQAEQRRAAGESLLQGEVQGLHAKIKEVATRLQAAQKAVAEGRKPVVAGQPQAPAVPLGVVPKPAGAPPHMAASPAMSSSAPGSSFDNIDPDDLMSMFEQQDAQRQTSQMHELQQRQNAELQQRQMEEQARQMAQAQAQLQQQQEAQRQQHQQMLEAQRQLQEQQLQQRILEQQRIQREREIASQIAEARREAEIEAQQAAVRRQAEMAEQLKQAQEAERASTAQLATLDAGQLEKMEEQRRQQTVQQNLFLLSTAAQNQGLAGAGSVLQKEALYFAKAPSQAKGSQKDRSPSPKKDPSHPKKKEEEEVLRCHLHAKKLNTKCKFCKRIIERNEANKKAQEEEDKDASSSIGGKERTKKDKVKFEVSNTTTFNMNPLLREQILRSEYYKRLLSIESISDLIDELAKAETVETHGVGMRAAGVVSTQPSTVFCCLLRFFLLEISHKELMRLVDSEVSPFVRVCGLLYIRYGSAPKDLSYWLEEYLIDDQEFLAEPANEKYITIGEYVEGLLMDDRYYHTSLPRVPVAVKKSLEAKCAPLGQCRKRNAANKKILENFRQVGTPVEVCTGGDWLRGEIVSLDDHIPTRTHVKVRLEDDTQETAYLGKVILADGVHKKRKRSRSRSNSESRVARSNSPDWTTFKGKSEHELLEELRAKLRDKAVASGKDYVRRDTGFNPSLAMKREMGAASSALYKEEMLVHKQIDYPIRGDPKVEEEIVDPQAKRKKQEAEEAKLANEKKLQELYQKYTATASLQSASGDMDVDKADVLRLG